MTALAAGRSSGSAPGVRARLVGPAALILGLGALLAIMLALPGQTVVTRAVDQLFLAYDGIHRVLSGQVPNRDFHSATGPLAFWVPAWGYVLSGGYGGALPTALALNLLLVTLAAAHVLASRLRAGLALLLAALLFFALAAPMHPGEPVSFLSYADLPNRVGWTATALLLVMFAEPLRDGRGTAALDALVAAALLLLAFYYQASYAAVALAFLLLVLLVGPRRPWAGAALLLAGLAAGAVEIAWGGTRQYLADVLTAFEAGGWLRGTPIEALRHLRVNLTDYLLVGLLATVALWRGWSPRLLLFLAFCLVARSWLITQNDPRWGTLPLYAAAAVLAEHLLRAMDRRRELPASALLNPAGVQLFFAALVMPTVVRCASAVMLHLGAAVAGGGTPLPFAGLEGVRLANLWTAGDFGGSTAYLEVVADGVEALSDTGLEAPRVLALGAPNAFSPILNLPPPQGDMANMRWDATLDANHHVPAADLLADVDVVIEPLDAGGPLRDFLLPEIEASFRPVVETEHWRLHRRSPVGEGTAVSTSVGRRGGGAE